MNIEYVGRDAIIDTPQVAFTYQVSETPRDFYKFKGESNNLDWDNKFDFIGDYIMYNYGSNNDLPDVIRDVVQNNYIAPGIIKKKTQLLWGSGPLLYKDAFVKNKPIREWQANQQITDWLESWDYETYLLKCATDHNYMEGVFTKYVLSKGSRVGNKFISKLEHCQIDRSRLATLKSLNTTDATHVIQNDWSFKKAHSLSEFKVYPLFNFSTPFEHKTSIFYSNMYSFCTDYYTVPDIYGSLEWLNRSTSVPLIFKALSKNSINLKYHIVSPQAFWDRKRDDMKSNCTQRGITFKEQMLTDYQNSFLKKIADVLSGDENTGKYLHTTKTFTVDGTNLIEHGWEVKVIDQNIKDFVDAQIKISQRADHALSSGIGLHSALGNVSETGKSDSGSEQLYALKNFLLTGVDIPEMIVMKAINYAIKANFPNTGLKLGFYHEVPEKEEDVSEQDRIKNN
jgi:hypothetical protein